MQATRALAVAAASSAVALASGGSAAYAASTTHTLPEWGRCTAVAAGSTGVYAGKSCLGPAASGRGRYEWTAPSVTEDITFTASGSEPVLASANHGALHCTATNMSGTLTGAQTATVTLQLTGCHNATGQECHSTNNPTSLALIESLPLEAKLGYIKHFEVEGKLHYTVGIDFKASSPATEIAVYECGTLGEINRIEGSVIAQISPLNTMSTALRTVFHATKSGVQVPESFAGEAPDTLSTTFTTGLESVTVPSSLTGPADLGSYSIPVEIKAIEL